MPFKFAVIMLIGLGIIVSVVFMDQGQRRIPIQYAKRIVGRKMTTGGSTYLPLKVNQAGVIPIIFATSVMYMPVLLGSIVPWQGFQNFVDRYLNAGEPDLRVHDRACVDDRVLRVLLHGDPVRPGEAGRQPAQAGRVHPGHPSGRAHVPPT